MKISKKLTGLIILKAISLLFVSLITLGVLFALSEILKNGDFYLLDINNFVQFILYTILVVFFGPPGFYLASFLLLILLFFFLSRKNVHMFYFMLTGLLFTLVALLFLASNFFTNWDNLFVKLDRQASELIPFAISGLLMGLYFCLLPPKINIKES